jgi:DNA-binding CsgD family transcriptional regulator
MNSIQLTPRQNQIVGLLATGLAQKEIANELSISPKTVDNTIQLVKIKLGLSKINELTGWWISKHFQIQIDFKELRKEIIAMSFLGLIIFQILNDPNDILTARRIRRYRKEFEIEYLRIE